MGFELQMNSRIYQLPEGVQEIPPFFRREYTYLFQTIKVTGFILANDLLVIENGCIRIARINNKN